MQILSTIMLQNIYNMYNHNQWPSGLGVRLEIKGSLVRSPVETYIFFFRFFACFPFLQVCRALANEIKHGH